MDRLGYAFVGGIMGALLGGACWLLFGLGLSARLWSWGIDPNPLHWVAAVGAGFALVGFLFKGKVGSILGDIFAALLNFEMGESSNDIGWRGILIIALVIGLAIWYVTK
ncbi:MAG TPA: hypothetical protein VK629_18670 [Steroidobacteraceae bacterium]|nr:hypothetical protein [Steroidobacteraceae bacterium]